MFFERLEHLCAENGSNVTAVLKELNLSTSKGTAWRNGSIPKGEVLSVLAKHFNVTTDYLLGNTHHPQVSVIPADPEKAFEYEKLLDQQRDESFQRIIDAAKGLEGARVAFHDGAFDGLDEDDMEMLKQMAEHLRAKKRTKDDTT